MSTIKPVIKPNNSLDPSSKGPTKVPFIQLLSKKFFVVCFFILRQKKTRLTTLLLNFSRKQQQKLQQNSLYEVYESDIRSNVIIIEMNEYKSCII